VAGITANRASRKKLRACWGEVEESAHGGAGGWALGVGRWGKKGGCEVR